MQYNLFLTFDLTSAVQQKNTRHPVHTFGWFYIIFFVCRYFFFTPDQGKTTLKKLLEAFQKIFS